MGAVADRRCGGASSSAPKATGGAKRTSSRGPRLAASSARRPSVACGVGVAAVGMDRDARRAALAAGAAAAGSTARRAAARSDASRAVASAAQAEREQGARHDDGAEQRQGDQMDPRRRRRAGDAAAVNERAARRSRLRRARRFPTARAAGPKTVVTTRVRRADVEEGAFPDGAVVEDEAARIQARDQAERERRRAGMERGLGAQRRERPAALEPERGEARAPRSRCRRADRRGRRWRGRSSPSMARTSGRVGRRARRTSRTQRARRSAARRPPRSRAARPRAAAPAGRCAGWRRSCRRRRRARTRSARSRRSSRRASALRPAMRCSAGSRGPSRCSAWLARWATNSSAGASRRDRLERDPVGPGAVVVAPARRERPRGLEGLEPGDVAGSTLVHRGRGQAERARDQDLLHVATCLRRSGRRERRGRCARPESR